MKQWIKLYTEALHDRKMRKLGRYEKSIFYDLLLLAGQEDNDGLLPDINDIALELDLKPNEAQKAVNTLINVGLLQKCNNGNFVVTHFKSRQETNMTGAERVARYRSNKRDNADVTQQRYTCNASDNANVTSERYNGNEKVTVEKEIEIDKEIEEDINSFSNEKELITRAKKTAYGSAQNVLLTDDEYAKLKARFVDADEKIENLSLGIASKGYKYKNHYATILNWARRDAEKQTAQPKKQPETTFGDIRNYFEAVATPQWDIDL